MIQSETGRWIGHHSVVAGAGKTTMFTGLVEECGRVISIEVKGETARLTIGAKLVVEDVRLGDSIAINGCCLTVVEVASDRLTFEAVPETLRRTNLGSLSPNDPVNLERPLSANGRLGGHFVQGHIDGVGIVRDIRPEQNAVIYEIEVPAPLRRYFIEKGSVAVDGISLTVASVTPQTFTVWIIPHTRDVTNLSVRTVGSFVNLECDLLGKYMERLLQERFVNLPDGHQIK